MAEEIPFKDATTTTQLKSLLGGGMKAINIRDAAGRLETLYEAAIIAEIGDPCLRTKYKYADGAGGTSRQVIAYEEDIVAWPGYELLGAGYANDIDLVP